MKRVILFVLIGLLACVVGCGEDLEPGHFTRECKGRMTEAAERKFKELSPCGPHLRPGVICRLGCGKYIIGEPEAQEEERIQPPPEFFEPDVSHT